MRAETPEELREHAEYLKRKKKQKNIKTRKNYYSNNKEKTYFEIWALLLRPCQKCDLRRADYQNCDRRKILRENFDTACFAEHEQERRK
jgi:hypothetical protein